jgi:hypothetical protein
MRTPTESPRHKGVAGAGQPSSLSVVAKSGDKLLLLLLSITRKHSYAAWPLMLGH